MPTPENILTAPENPTANRKNNPQKAPQEQPQKCPRCDSSNTKFCYYNNYSLTQPRHFCKTCRRYWTRGGALRNVPIGGGCRKTNKRLRTVSSQSLGGATSGGATKLMSISGAEFGHHGFKFLGSATNLNPAGVLTPAVDFDLGPKLHPATAGVYTQFITSSNVPNNTIGDGHVTGGDGPYFGLDLMGLNYSTSSSMVQANIGGNENQISISSIESLSSINQEMHWKLQQQRLSMIYGPISPQNNDENTIVNDHVKPQEAINLFGNNNNNNNNNNNTSPTSRKMDVGPNDWLFDNQISNNQSPVVANNYGGNLNEVNTNINMGVNNTSNNSCENVNRGVESNMHGVWGDLLNNNNHRC